MKKRKKKPTSQVQMQRQSNIHEMMGNERGTVSVGAENSPPFGGETLLSPRSISQQGTSVWEGRISPCPSRLRGPGAPSPAGGPAPTATPPTSPPPPSLAAALTSAPTRASSRRAGGAGRGRRGSGHPRSLTAASKALADLISVGTERGPARLPQTPPLFINLIAAHSR